MMNDSERRNVRRIGVPRYDGEPSLTVAILPYLEFSRSISRQLRVLEKRWASKCPATKRQPIAIEPNRSIAPENV